MLTALLVCAIESGQRPALLLAEMPSVAEIAYGPADGNPRDLLEYRASADIRVFGRLSPDTQRKAMLSYVETCRRWPHPRLPWDKMSYRFDAGKLDIFAVQKGERAPLYSEQIEVPSPRGPIRPRDIFGLVGRFPPSGDGAPGPPTEAQTEADYAVIEQAIRDGDYDYQPLPSEPVDADGVADLLRLVPPPRVLLQSPENEALVEVLNEDLERFSGLQPQLQVVGVRRYLDECQAQGRRLSPWELGQWDPAKLDYLLLLNDRRSVISARSMDDLGFYADADGAGIELWPHLEGGVARPEPQMPRTACTHELFSKILFMNNEGDFELRSRRRNRDRVP